MVIKGGATQQTVFDTIRILVVKGLTIGDAIEEVESTLRGQLPDHIKELIYLQCG